MGQKYLIRDYAAADREEIFGLISLVWGEGFATRIKQIWRWKIEDNPFKNDDIPVTLVVEHAGSIVGLISVMPAPFNVANQEVTGLWLGDYLVHPDHRGPGARLMKIMMKKPYLLLGETNDQSYPIVKKLGWSDVFTVTNRISIIDMRAIIEQKTGNIVLANIGGVIWRLFRKMAVKVRRAPCRELFLEQVTSFDQRIDCFWDRVKSQYGSIVSRNRQYLNWRFVERPDRKYTMFVISDEQMVHGYIVISDEIIDGMKFGHIIDVLVTPGKEDAFNRLVAKGVEELAGRGVALVTCYVSPYNDLFHKLLKKNGFYFKTAKRRIVYFNNNKDISDQVLADRSLWFISKSDADMEMN